MKRLLTFVMTMVAALSAHAIFDYSASWNSGFANSGVVPDYTPDMPSWVDSRTVSGQEGIIQSVSVLLNMSGGWNGDMYAYLQHGLTGFTVLLNQIGTGANGNAGIGFNVTFSDSGTTGLGDYMGNGSGVLTGTWQPDGAGFGSFTGLDPNGGWNLYIQDGSKDGVMTVNSWGLQLGLSPVPEVETWVSAALLGLVFVGWQIQFRARWGKKPVPAKSGTA